MTCGALTVSLPDMTSKAVTVVPLGHPACHICGTASPASAMTPAGQRTAPTYPSAAWWCTHVLMRPSAP